MFCNLGNVNLFDNLWENCLGILHNTPKDLRQVFIKKGIIPSNKIAFGKKVFPILS